MDQWGSSGLRKDAVLGRRDEGGLGSPHARVYGKWPPADARRVAPIQYAVDDDGDEPDAVETLFVGALGLAHDLEALYRG